MKLASMMTLVTVTAALLYASAATEDQADICETELMACNNTCDNETPTEMCYQECQEKFEACLNEVESGPSMPEGMDEAKEPKEE